MTRKRLLVAIVLSIFVIMAGCSGAGGGGDSGAADGGAGGGDAAAEPRATQAGPEAEAAAGGETFQVTSRSVIRTGHVSLEVSDFDAAQRNLTTALERNGGFVSDSQKRRHRVDNQTYTTGVLVVRVPASNFSSMLTRIEAEGTVQSVDTASEDVTDQLVDIEARLENLRVQRDRLRTLYDEANTTRDVLAVQRELSDVQEEIERLEARQQSLERRVAFSTIRIELAEPTPQPDPGPIDKWYDIGFITAFLESVDGVIIVVRGLVVIVAYALPYLLAFGAPVVVGYGAWRYRDRLLSLRG